MKRSAIIAITLALASAAVAAPNGLGRATNLNRAMRSGFAQRQRNNITNDIENARANAKRDFIRSQDEYKAIDSRAEEKFKLILEDNCRNWKAGCGKGVIISDGNSNSIVYGEDGRLLEISSWEDLETTKWIKSEQQRVEQSIIETKSAEITAAEDAAEKAVRDRYAEQEAKHKADEEKRVAEQKAKEEQRKIDDEKRAADRKAQDDKLAAERKAERERRETERQNTKAHDEAEALRKENLLRQFFFEHTGLKLGISTNELPGSVKSTWQSDVVIIDLPRTFRHYKTAEARFYMEVKLPATRRGRRVHLLVLPRLGSG